MAATTISRTWYDTLVDDDGSGTTGTVIDKADFDAILDAIDGLFSSTTGITLNQAGGDSFILTLESSDVAHGLTGAPSTNAFGSFQKTTAGQGGLQVTGWLETGLDHSALFLCGNQLDAAQTTKSTSGLGVTRIRAQVNGGAVGANGNLLSIDNHGTTRFILDADGDSHQDVGTAWTNFDDHEDVELLHALSAGVSRKGDPLRRSFSKLLSKHRGTLERNRIVTFNTNGHHFVNWSRLNMLIVGAIRQQAGLSARTAVKVSALSRQVATLRRQVKAA